MQTSVDSHQSLRALCFVHNCVPSVLHHGPIQRPLLWHMARCVADLQARKTCTLSPAWLPLGEAMGESAQA
jgi:hypothetical protein